MAAPSVITPDSGVRAYLDHIVVGVSDLDAGMAAFERMTSIAATRGGRHPARGTENALVSLGLGRYLELIAPGADATPSRELEQFRSLGQPTIVTWAVNVRDIAAARETLSQAGVMLGDEMPGSRVTSSGSTLEWSTAEVASPRISGAPFLIHWSAATEHPSTTSPAGCRLAALQVEDPAAADLSRALNVLRVSGVTVRRGDARISATLTSPRGTVVLHSR
jgi:Glyoxalase-like domain